MTAFILFALACHSSVSFENGAVFSSVEQLMRDDTTRTGFFTNSSLFDTSYAYITYETTRGRVTVPNTGGQDFLLCRYAEDLQPIWVAVGGGRGGDGGLNYYAVPPENCVFVTGCFEDTAYFPHRVGEAACDTLMSRGHVDLFVASYAYDTGELQWITSAGSAYSDVVFMLGDERHQEVFMLVDSAALTVYANFFGPVHVGDTLLDCKIGGEAVWIRFDKKTGEVIAAGHPTTVPSMDEQ